MTPLGEWLLRSVLLGGLVAIGAWALEEALRGWSRPTRFVWVGALLVSVTLPLLTRFAPELWPAVLHRSTSAVPVSVLELLAAADASAVATNVGRRGVSVGDLLLPAWLLISALCGLRWLHGFWRLRRVRTTWRAARVGELPVLVSEQLGPAVVGLHAPRVVLPVWLLTTDAKRLALIVRHETEHARAGDQWLLALAPIAAVLFPWSPALWWQLRRLRLAVELDCDARVLRSGVPALEYGSVLLDVAGGTLPLHPTLAALAEPRSFLERRIRAMTAMQHRHVGLRAAALAGVTLVTLFGAALTGAPATELSAQRTPPPPPPPAPARTARPTPPPPPPPAPTAEYAEQQQGGEPIFVIDGVIQSQRGKLSAAVLNDMRVGTIEVLKPEQAVRRFGARGRYGAVVITTAPAREDVVVNASADEPVLARKRLALTADEKLDEAKLAAKMLKAEIADKMLKTNGDPMFVLDGVVYEQGAAVLSRLDPQLIDRVEVVKGQAAVELYGERGRNGVIIIFTKR